MVVSDMSADTIARSPRPGEGPTSSAAAAEPEPVSAAATPTNRGSVRIQSASVSGLFVLAAIYTIYFAKPVLMPVVAAAVLYILLWPAVRLLSRIRIPTPFGAAIVVAGLLGIAGTGIYVLADPASAWLSQAPKVMSELQSKIKAPVSELNKAKERLEQLVQPRSRGGGAAPRAGRRSALPTPRCSCWARFSRWAQRC